jgi:glutamate synthase domain-containing protein 2
LAVIAFNAAIYTVFPAILWSFVLFGPIILLGIRDMTQKSHTLLRNFPVAAHFRYLFESIRPEISQYFIETDTSGRPYSRLERSLVYTRAKKVNDTIPFGTQLGVYDVGYEWVNHSILPIHIPPEEFRVMVGGKDCKQPYNASRLNISAMSFGSLSRNAIEALSSGAKMGGFAHNTGEGGISPYHLKGGADLIWQIGTGYFGCRTKDGKFNPDSFKERAALPNVKMIEIKVSQGAKPGHGGILPAAKVTEEISKIRDVPMGEDVLSPPAHSAFTTPLEMVQFIKQLRDLSGGKPVGFKMCLGRQIELVTICKAMIETDIYPDFITIDGGEGGTGAAPVEFSNHIGSPLMESLIFTDNTLKGFGIRDEIKIIASGKVASGFDMVKRLALGADMCNAARTMMMAIGCIQALKCNTNECPVGVATQDAELAKGLVVANKSVRVRNYHDEMLGSVREIMGAMGIKNPDALFPGHLMRRTAPNEIKSYADIYPSLNNGDLVSGNVPEQYEKLIKFAKSDSFVG